MISTVVVSFSTPTIASVRGTIDPGRPVDTWSYRVSKRQISRYNHEINLLRKPPLSKSKLTLSAKAFFTSDAGRRVYYCTTLNKGFNDAKIYKNLAQICEQALAKIKKELKRQILFANDNMFS